MRHRVVGTHTFRGEQTESVLAEVCGYSPERIDELASAGVFGA
jgi:hypothetical protein